MTRIAYVIGTPIGHSLSPTIHNAAFAACGVDARYEAVEVRPLELEAWVAATRHEEILGFNVTVPHKETIASLLDELEGDAQLTGAVNTVIVERGTASGERPHPNPLPEGEGVSALRTRHSALRTPHSALRTRLVGANTDTVGFRRSLADEAGVALRAQHVVLLGAGGAARAIALVALQDGAASLAIANRHFERGAQLCADLTCFAGSTQLGAIELAGSDLTVALEHATIVVNATSVGLRSTDVPIDPSLIRPASLVVDIVYNPLKTAFLESAERRGASILGGLGMLVHQAAAAFERWTGLAAPIPAMRAAAERVLSHES